MKKIFRTISVISVITTFIIACNSPKKEDTTSNEMIKKNDVAITNENILAKWELIKSKSNDKEIPIDIYGGYTIEFTAPDIMITVKGGLVRRIKYILKNQTIINQENEAEKFEILALTKDTLTLVNKDESGITELIFKRAE